MDEDDVHFCMRCKTQVQGLEQYIQHRKDGCPAQGKNQGSFPVITPENIAPKVEFVTAALPVEDEEEPPERTQDVSVVEKESKTCQPQVGRPRRKQRTPKVSSVYLDPDEVLEEEEKVDYKLPTRRGRPKGSKKMSLKVATSIKRVSKPRRKFKVLLTCDFCSFSTSTEKRMAVHNNSPTHEENVAVEQGTEKSFKCHICQESFCLDRSLRSHSRVHSSKAICQECNTFFPTKVSLRKHLLESGHTTKYTCTICNKDFPIEAHLKVHMTVHMEEKPFDCKECDFKTKRRADLNIHMKRHLGIKPFKCTLCPFKSVKRSVLTRHMETHKERPRDLICHVCGAAYCSKMVLQHHIFTQHLNGRRYRCDFEGCTYIFCYKSELVAHKRSHTKEKPYLCSVCGYEGSNTYALTKHMRIHTKEKPFICPFQNCKYASRFSAHLVRHKRLHTGEKPYKCPFCNYRCNAQENLRKHVKNTKKHAGKNMYMCKDCDFNTNNYKELVHHTRSKHGNEYIKLQDVSRVCGIFQPGAMSNTSSQNIVEQALAESLGGEEMADDGNHDDDVVPKTKENAAEHDTQDEAESELVIDQSGLIHQAITQARSNMAGSTDLRNGGPQPFQIQAAQQGATDYLVIGPVYGGRGTQQEMEPQHLEIATSGGASASQSVAEAMRCLAQGFDDRSPQVSFVVTNIVQKDGTIANQSTTAPQPQEVSIHTVPQSSQYAFYGTRATLPSHSRSEVVATPVDIVASTSAAPSQHVYPVVGGNQVEIVPMTTSYQTVTVDALPSTSSQVRHVPESSDGRQMPFSQSLVQAVQRVRESTDEVTAVTILQEMDANADRILQQKDGN